MNKIIIITGDLASGKSTLAVALAKKEGMDCYIKDAIKERLVDRYGFKNREENHALSVKAMEEMLHQFSLHVYEHKDLILEANFRNDEMNKIKVLADYYSYQIIAFRLIGEYHELYRRFLLRLPTRHIAHTSLHLDENFEKFSEYLNYLREQEIPFDYCELDTTELNEKEVLEKAINYIKIEK